VGGFSYLTKIDKIGELLSEIQLKYSNLDIPTDRIDKSKTKGYALVTTIDHTTIMRLNGLEVEGRIIRVEEANAIKKKENNSGERINNRASNNSKIVNQINKKNSDVNQNSLNKNEISKSITEVKTNLNILEELSKNNVIWECSKCYQKIQPINFSKRQSRKSNDERVCLSCQEIIDNNKDNNISMENEFINC